MLFEEFFANIITRPHKHNHSWFTEFWKSYKKEILIRFLLLFLFKTSAITLKYVNGKHGWSFLVVLKSFIIMHYLYIFMFKTAAHKCNSPKPSFACKLFSPSSFCPMPSFYVLLFCLAGMDEDGSFMRKKGIQNSRLPLLP